MIDVPPPPVPVQPEVRTRRLVVTDEAGAPRIVGEVLNGAAELRVELPGDATRTGQVLIYAVPSAGDGLGPDLGVQLWADGYVYAEMNLSLVDDRWAAEMRVLSDPTP